MKSPLPGFLQQVIERCKDDSGETAQYIPELAAANPNHQGIALSTIDGDVYTAGDVDIEFAIESISKAFTYALALEDQGFAYVDKKVSVEPSGDPFNQLSLDPKTGRPDNPLINAGAITTHTLVKGKTPRERYDRIADAMSRCAGRKLRVMEDVYSSEMKTADRNRALAYMLHSTGIIEGDPMTAVEYYTRQCSLAVTARDLAVMVATLANRGVQPVTGEQIFSHDVVVRVLSVVLSCGMYDYAGDWITAVGMPAKSGVGGGIIAALPGQLGIATFSPRLESHGNSYRGIKMFELMSQEMGLHLMKVCPPAHSAVRKNRTVDLPPKAGRPAKLRVVAVQGGVNFVAAEKVCRDLADISPKESIGVVLDLRGITSMHDVATVLIADALQELIKDGHKVAVIDPDGVLPKDKLKDAESHDTLEALVPPEVLSQNTIADD